MKHLTDTDIQTYLEGPGSEKARAFDDHLSGCRICRRRVDEYKSLFAHLGDDSAVPVVRGLADKVMASVTAARAPDEPSSLADLVLTGAGVLLAAAALYIFVGLQPLSRGLAMLGGSLPAIMSAGLGAAKDFGRPTLIAAAAVVFLVYIINGLPFCRARTRGHNSRG